MLDAKVDAEQQRVSPELGHRAHCHNLAWHRIANVRDISDKSNGSRQHRVFRAIKWGALALVIASNFFLCATNDVYRRTWESAFSELRGVQHSITKMTYACDEPREKLRMFTRCILDDECMLTASELDEYYKWDSELREYCDGDYQDALAP